MRSFILIWCLVSAACVDGFRGSNVQIDLANGIAVQASSYGTLLPGQLSPNSHYALYALEDIETGTNLFELQRFEIHPIVDLDSPCFIDVGDHVPHPGLHVSQYANQIKLDTKIDDITMPPDSATEQDRIALATALQRKSNVELLAGAAGIHVVSSASEGGYPAVAADCNGPDDEIPPPACTEPAANARRLRLCQQAWAADRAYFEGTDRILTAPLNGITAGMVDGMNPVNLALVGGAQFFVDEALAGFDAFAIYTQTDGVDGPGALVLYGTPTRPTRGVTHVHMTGVTNPGLAADLAIFANLGEDDVTF